LDRDPRLVDPEQHRLAALGCFAVVGLDLFDPQRSQRAARRRGRALRDRLDTSMP